MNLINILKKLIKVSVIICLLYVIFNIYNALYVGYLRYTKIIQKPVVNFSDKEGRSKVHEFNQKFNLTCKDESVLDRDLSMSTLGSNIKGYYGLHAFGSDIYKPYGLYLSCKDPTAESKGIDIPFAYYVVNGNSKEVEMYANRAVYEIGRKKAGWSPVAGDPRGRVNWPPFMPKEEASQIVDSLAPKLEIPTDMVFDRIEQNEKNGVWNAIWLRKKDGYWYAGDAVSINIMGATGEFIGYTKTYRGTPCPTEVKVTKEKALDLGWNKVRKNIPWKLRKQMNDYYKVGEATLLIVQPNNYWGYQMPQKNKDSRLAWVISYHFSGGLIDPRPDKPAELFTQEEDKASSRYLAARFNKWNELDRPERHFNFWIDAATGEFLYISDVTPWYRRWLIK